MSLFQLLNSPIPVAYFQYLCGVRWKNPNPKNPLYPTTDTERSSQNEVKKERNFLILNRFLFFLAKAGTELAGEPFYYIFFPACAWIFQLNVARRTFLLLSTSMFIGQSLKDIIRQPRPASPPVIRLEAMYETEYGMPSTHVMAAVTVSFSFLLFSSEEYQVPLRTGLIVASSWSLCVIISRIYLGMHTILEVAAGTALSLTIIYIIHPLVEWFEKMQLKSGLPVTLSVGIGCLIMAKIMFSLDSDINSVTGKANWNTARGDMTEILAWCAGFLIGSKYAVEYDILSPMTNVGRSILLFDDETFDAVFRCSLRLAFGGLFILLPFTLGTRKLLTHFFIRIHGLQHLSLEEAKKICCVELPYKFISAFLSGLVGTLLVPSLLQRFQMW